MLKFMYVLFMHMYIHDIHPSIHTYNIHHTCSDKQINRKAVAKVEVMRVMIERGLSVCVCVFV